MGTSSSGSQSATTASSASPTKTPSPSFYRARSISRRTFAQNPAHIPEGTDLAIWTWEETRNTPLKGPVTVYMGIAFAGKANKPLWHYFLFKTPESRQKMIDETVASRKGTLQRKQEEMQKKKDFVHGIKVGDIFSSSWGYDQTNVDFFQCVDVKGKMVVVREISSKLSHSDRGADYVVAAPNHFTGEA